MAKQPKVYQRLTRNAMGLASFSNLWLASDHLLLVNSTGYTEKYSRVMLRDIKGLFITRTDRRSWWNFPWGIMAIIAGVRVIAVFLAGDRPVASAILFAVGVVGLIWNSLLGEGCQVYVQTGVQTAKLSSLVRLKKARRVIARLQPMILEAQADLVETPVAAAPAAEAPATAEAAAAPIPAEAPTATANAPTAAHAEATPADAPATNPPPTEPATS